MNTKEELIGIGGLIMICILAITAFMEPRSKCCNANTKTIFTEMDSILALGKQYREWNRANLLNELFIYYVDSLERIGYSSDWACEKASIELGLKEVSSKYVAIEED